MTTPYVLIETTKAEWIAFLKRTMIQCGPNDRTRLRNLLKYGLGQNYWNEFIFKAYRNCGYIRGQIKHQVHIKGCRA